MSFVVLPSAVIRVGAKPAAKSVSSFFVNIFKNKGVQAGTGLAAIGGGIAVLGAGAESATGEFSPIFSPIIVIAIIIVIIMLVLKR